MVQPHILVVDDNLRLREVLRQVLQREGCRVSLAATGREALESCRQDPPDLLVLRAGIRGQRHEGRLRDGRGLRLSGRGTDQGERQRHSSDGQDGGDEPAVHGSSGWGFPGPIEGRRGGPVERPCRARPVLVQMGCRWRPPSQPATR